jgi:hypothetical protein
LVPGAGEIINTDNIIKYVLGKAALDHTVCTLHAALLFSL